MNTILTGDCLSVLPTLPANSVDSVICDPPYGLDFMGKSWDHGVPGVEFWQAALRVAKPGAILMAFGGTRTFHRLACAIEDAGWELRDTMCWLYGSGFPKSLDISKAIDRAAGAEREVVGKYDSRGRFDNCERGSIGTGEVNTFLAAKDYGEVSLTAPSTPAAHLWQGYGTALKPAWEPIIVAMKPLEGTYAENAQKWGVAGLNIDGGRIGTAGGGGNGLGSHYDRLGDTEPKVKFGDDHTNSLGRWPANLLLDEEAARLLDEQSGELGKSQGGGNGMAMSIYGSDVQKNRGQGNIGFGDSGGASRFFYTSKASSSERNAGLEDCEPERDADRIKDDGVGGDNPRNRSNNAKQNVHPTVKPVSLMRYLCKLTRTPTGGVVLDPFMGSGTTGIACVLEHRDFVGIEIDEKYAEIARKRIDDITGPLFIQPEVKHGDSYLYN